MAIAKYDEKTVGRDAVLYLNAHRFIELMKKCKKHITAQQYSTLRGQALHGDLAGAEKGLAKLMGWRSK